MKKMIALLFVVCLTPKQVNDRVCAALCSKQYDGGYSHKDQCICTVYAGKIEDFKRGRIKIDSGTYFKPEPTPPPVVPFGD